MYRAALVGLLALAFLDLAAACPRAPHREVIVNGIKVKEYYCNFGKVLFKHENIYRCFERSFDCPNGFTHEKKCHCFPGTHDIQPGVCGPICPNCENGWCYSTTMCMCNDGFLMMNGKCVVPAPMPITTLNNTGAVPMYPVLPAPWYPYPVANPYYGYPNWQPGQPRPLLPNTGVANPIAITHRPALQSPLFKLSQPAQHQPPTRRWRDRHQQSAPVMRPPITVHASHKPLQEHPRPAGWSNNQQHSNYHTTRRPNLHLNHAQPHRWHNQTRH